MADLVIGDGDLASLIKGNGSGFVDTDLLGDYDENGDKKGEKPVVKAPVVEDDKKEKVDSAIAEKPNVEEEPELVPSSEDGGKVEEDIKISKDGVDYKDMIEKMTKEGIFGSLDGVEFDIDGQVVKFKDMDVKDEDQFYDLVKTVIENEREEALKNKIDASSISDFTKKLIDADKKGVDVVSVLHQYEKYKAPIDKLDLNERDGQIKVIEHYYRSKGLSDEDVKDMMDSIKDKDDSFIEEKAVKFKAVIDEQMEQLIEKQKEEAVKKKAEDEKAVKEFKSSVRAQIKDTFDVNDSTVSKMIDFAFKPIGDEKNGYKNQIYDAYINQLFNKETAPALIMFLMDRNEYIRQATSKKVKEEKSKVWKMVTGTSKSRGAATIGDKDDKAIDISNLI